LTRFRYFSTPWKRWHQLKHYQEMCFLL
jgi:hypothetical protein